MPGRGQAVAVEWNCRCFGVSYRFGSTTSESDAAADADADARRRGFSPDLFLNSPAADGSGLKALLRPIWFRHVRV